MRRHVHQYKNDVLHALKKTYGMPGDDAKYEILIYRGLFSESVDADLMLQNLCSGNCDDYPELLLL